MERQYANTDLAQDSNDIEAWWSDAADLVPEDKANLVTSLLKEDPAFDFGQGPLHAPAIDLDFPARLVPSSTEGHFHLFIDSKLTWPQYVCLLTGFLMAGLIQKRWYQAAMARGYSALRHNTTKQKEAEDRGR